MRRLMFVGFAALALTACGGSKKSGPAVAKGDGITITAEEFKARIEEQSPFMRARYSTLEKKKEFLDNLIRFEVLAREAEKQGYRNDPEVQQTLRKIMVQKMVQKTFRGPAAAPADVPDADVQKYYDEHAAEFHRPKRVRAAVVVLNAPAGPERAKKLALARKALASLQAADKDKKDPAAFAKLVASTSDDAATKAAGGDMGLKTLDEIEKTYSKELAQAVSELKQGELTGVVEAPAALYIARVTLVQDAVDRPLDQVKPQIVARLSRDKKTKEFDEWVTKLRDSAKIQVDEKALEAVEIAAPAGIRPGGPLAPGMHPLPPGGAAPAMSLQPPAGSPPPAPASSQK